MSKKNTVPMHDSLKVAQHVLDVVNRIGIRVPKRDMMCYAYSNLREQGYCIKFWPAKMGNPYYVTFAQHRSCDDIVVYEGGDFDISSNIPSDKAFETASFFKQVNDAAHHVVATIESHSKGIKKNAKKEKAAV